MVHRAVCSLERDAGTGDATAHNRMVTVALPSSAPTVLACLLIALGTLVIHIIAFETQRRASLP